MEPIYHHEPSTSASTIRGLRRIDMALVSSSVSEPEPASAHDEHPETHSPFQPSTPHSAFQSEPGSPSGDSISSFPSAGSSFLFSSGPTSPPHPAQHSEAEDEDELGDSTSGLVIPSLLLPSPSRRPTVYGQTLGDVRLLMLGPKGSDMSAIASQLVDDNEDVVEVGLWEEVRQEDVATRGKRKAILQASTHWTEHRDRHGLERIEPARNIEIVELPAYDIHSEARSVVERVLPVIHSPFREVIDILNHEHPPSGTLAHLLSSSCSPLYTALILLANPSAPSPTEKTLIESISPHIPIILLPPPSPLHSYPHPHLGPSSSHDRSRRASPSYLSAFRPTSIAALRTGLFRTPNALATLRSEAAGRFLRWREVERAVERVQWSASTGIANPGSRSVVQDKNKTSANRKIESEWWDKQAWEAQWEDSLSQEVALHLRRRRRSNDPQHRISPLSPVGRQPQSASFVATTATSLFEKSGDEDRSVVAPPCPSVAFDPLHLPSLAVFSFSLLGALRMRVARALGLQRADPAPRRRSSTVHAPARGERIGSRKGAEPSRDGGRARYTFGLGLALVSAFCAGMGIGLVAVTRF